MGFKPEKVLFIRAGNKGVGDSLFLIPTLIKFRELHPQAHITYVLSHRVGHLLDGNDYVNETIPLNILDLSHQLFLKIKLWGRKFDLIVVAESAKITRIVKKWAKNEIWGYDPTDPDLTRLFPWRPELHEVINLLGIFPDLSNINPDSFPMTIELKKKPRLKIDLPEGILAGFHMGCSAANQFSYGRKHLTGKQSWPVEYYAEVGNYLSEKYRAHIVLTGSQAEVRLGKIYLQQKLNHKPVFFFGKTNTLELAHLISKCALFISGDTGPMHVAAALGIPLIAPFGVTDWRHTAPWGRSDRTFIVKSEMDCCPCGVNSDKCFYPTPCMSSIKSREIIDIIETRLSAAL